MYASERIRESSRVDVGSLDEWLKSLQMTVTMQELCDANLQRTVQLLNKTNQMNLSTRRMSEAEYVNWSREDNRRVFTFRVADKFGDSGLTGILSLEADNNAATIVDYVLSCRVMGRKVEETMLHAAAMIARELGAKQLRARYIQTDRNRPCLDAFKRSGFDYDELSSTFSWLTDREYALPESITYEVEPHG
jgi:FkbH-like protein